jgi:DNA-binding IclR family transcriptional regulator
MRKSAEEPRYSAPALEKGLDVLELLAAEPHGLNLQDICFPVFDHFGAVASLNIAYLKQRDSRVSIPAAREKLRHAAQAISKALGWLRRAAD